MRSRKAWRVWVAWRTRIELIVTGRVELSPTYGVFLYKYVLSVRYFLTTSSSYHFSLPFLRLLELCVDALVGLAFPPF